MIDRQRDRRGGAERDNRHEDGFLYRFEARLDVVPIGLVPEGIRMANSFDGTVTEGVFEGARVWGIDHFLLRTDGVGIVDASKTISGDGYHLFEHVRAYCAPPDGMEMPPLEVLLEPDFEWPDVSFPIHGFSMFRAPTPELEHLNRAVARIDGWANMRTGGLAVETVLTEHRPTVRGPAEQPRAKVEVAGAA